MNKPLAVSYSKLALYRECPLKYKFRYIDKLPEKPKHFFAFGNGIHRALEFMYKTNPFDARLLIDAFIADWGQTSYISKGYKSQEDSDSALRDGVAMLGAYYAKHKGFEPARIYSTEFRLVVKIDGLSLTSIVDRIDYTGAAGLLNVVDYKTGKYVTREPDQLYMYQKALEASAEFRDAVAFAGGIAASTVRVNAMCFLHVPSLTEDWIERATDMRLGMFWDRVLMTADDIRSARFNPTPEYKKCMFCDFGAECPACLAPSKHRFAGSAYPQIPMARRDETPALIRLLEAGSILADVFVQLGHVAAVLKPKLDEAVNRLKEGK